MNDNKTYALKNNNGLEIDFIAYGARLTSILIPDGDEKVDILLGYSHPEDYLTGDPYMNAICGPYANRIKDAEFELEGKVYQLEANDGKNLLHGGKYGFHQKYWQVENIALENYACAYKLSTHSPDGEGNFPGNVQIEVIYALNNANELLIDIAATTDKMTILNVTSHPYFNLMGIGNTINDHIISVNADKYTELDDENIPTGNILSVESSPMDLRKSKLLNDIIYSNYPEIKVREGLDHNWIVNKQHGELALAAKVTEPTSGRSVEVYTTQPGIQVYTAMHFDNTEIGKQGKTFTKYGGIAMEAQHFADAPHHSKFPSCVLKPGEPFKESIIYKFGF